MSETQERKKFSFGAWFRLCPLRHVLSAVFGLIIAAYFLLRSNEALLDALSEGFVRPWHRALSTFCDLFPFSVAEALIVLAILGAAVYIISQVVLMLRRGEKLKRLYRIAMTAVMAFCVIYGGFCTLWGIYFYTADFEERSGIYAEPLSTEQLETTTRYFTALLNECAEAVPRDEEGVFAVTREEIFDLSPTLYENVCLSFPCLEGPALRCKPFFFSEILSRITFTGFFFPFTAEANINVHSPECMLPSTIAHELAHQRGVAQEDEANFVAVLASLESGSDIYCYSACLMAYIHLSNALYAADYEAWLDNYYTLSPGVLADIKMNNAYWDRYRDTVVNAAADTVYTGLLHSYGQSDGLKTYGKCIDLLVAYYYDEAAAYLSEVK